MKPDKPVCLVLDELSVLVSVGVRLVEVVGLVQYCQHMVTTTADSVSHCSPPLQPIQYVRPVPANYATLLL